MDETRPTNRSKRQKPPEDGFWECSVCTYRNSPEAYKCDMCDIRKGTSTRKPRLNSQLVAQQAAQQFVPVAAPPCKRERSSTGLEFNSDFEFSDNSNQGLNSHFFEDPISNDNSLDHSLDIPEVQLPESLKQEKQLPEIVKREKEKQLHENVKREKEKQIPEKVKREKEKQLPDNIKQEKEKQLPEILKQGKPEKQILPENIKHEKKEKPEKHNLKHEKHAKPEKKPKKVNRIPKVKKADKQERSEEKISVTVNNVTVIITDYVPKKVKKRTSIETNHVDNSDNSSTSGGSHCHTEDLVTENHQ
ncbi:RING1 and YY1-binding protein B-like [Mytilus trossulus]|uniref:RING1 and YY1-binding protein B-like n=1 Tax=Mytilus trossulus TaxID=6551 RepID=UPI003006A4D3